MIEGSVGRPWSEAEIEATVGAYFQMFEHELRGEKYNKAEFNRSLQKITGRSKGSIEFKHSNISSILRDNHALYINGYKPRSNVQASLRRAVLLRLYGDKTLERLMFSEVRSDPPISSPDFVMHPTRPPSLKYTPVKHSRRAVNVDFMRLESENGKLGHAGELAVVRYEQEKLFRAGRANLAAKVEHVSMTKGDGLGFDVLSFDVTGKERFIEVKTTRQTDEWPFMVSRNEVAFSKDAAESFHLYRVYQFRNRTAGLYVLPGALGESCRLDPVTFQAVPA